MNFSFLIKLHLTSIDSFFQRSTFKAPLTLGLGTLSAWFFPLHLKQIQRGGAADQSAPENPNSTGAEIILWYFRTKSILLPRQNYLSHW